MESTALSPPLNCHTTRASRSHGRREEEQHRQRRGHRDCDTLPSNMSGPTFVADPALLNPDFEAYKLDVSPYVSKSWRLPSQVSYGKHGSSSDLIGFKELKDRLNQQRLVSGSRRGRLVYIDDAGFLVLIVISKADKRPSFHPLHNIHPPDDAVPPSVCSLPKGQWLVCDGGNTLQIVSTDERSEGRRWSANIVKTFTVQRDAHMRLLDARLDRGQEDVLALVQNARKVSNDAATHGLRKSATKTVFDVSLLSLPLGEASVDGERVSPLWTVTGDEPAYSSVLAQDAVGPHTIIAEEAFSRLGEDDGSRGSNETTLSVSPSREPPPKRHRTSSSAAPREAQQYPFSWWQTSDSLTVIFQLPATLQSTDFRVHFSPGGLSVSLVSDALDRIGGKIIELDNDTTPDALLETATTLSQGHFTSRATWAPINASDSVWTWERVGRNENEKGLLTLHLEKMHEATRWSRVFEKRQTSTEEESEAPETLDPSDLLNMIQGLEKYTTEGHGDEDPILRPGGLESISQQRDSLLQDALEPEDAIVGRRCILSNVNNEQVKVSSNNQYSLAESIMGQEKSLVLRHDLDGLLFTLNYSTHTDTFPALSFVLASKRDINRVYVWNGKIFAFENSTAASKTATTTGPGNLFVYHSMIKGKYAPSRVFRLADDDLERGDEVGSLMGVAVVSCDDGGDSGESVLVCLCEKTLLVLSGIV